MHSESRKNKSEQLDGRRADRKDANGQGNARSDLRANEDARNLKVLIVEDVSAVREALSLYLEFHGYDVASASGFDAAIKSASRRPPDVAVCDRQLGEDRDGIDVARTLQRRHGSRLVFVSATSMNELRAQTSDLDVAAYLKKPVVPGRIEAAVRRAANGSTDCG